MKNYPDISELIKRKEAYRRTLAELPFEKKIELVFKLQERQRFIKSGQIVDAQPICERERETEN